MLCTNNIFFRPVFVLSPGSYKVKDILVVLISGEKVFVYEIIPCSSRMNGIEKKKEIYLPLLLTNSHLSLNSFSLKS